MMENENRADLPSTKFGLIEKVGSKGKYQQMLLVIFCAVWAITGMSLIGITFFFLNPTFKCQKKGLLTDDCHSTVCSLPKKMWQSYIEVDQNDIRTIPAEFGHYYCGDTIYVDMTMTCAYVGALVGYLLFSFFADNYGRRITFIIAWGIATIGALIFLFSQSLVMTGIGLFCLGAGADASVNMCFNFLGEVVEDKTRQQYSVMIQPWFAIGACFVTTAFIWIKNWRIVALILIAIPSVIILFFIVIYVEETPQFLIRQGVEKTQKALNRIGKINKGIKNIITEEDVINVINEQVEDKQFQKVITPLDLCRFPSLRLVTICLCFLSFVVYALYYGPVLVIDRIGFNVFVSSYVVQFSELIVYIPLYFNIEKIPRKKAGAILLSIAGVCAGILIFVTKPKVCNFCPEAIIEIVIVAIFRACGALYFIILYIYMVELYPSRSRAMGCGIASAVGTMASSLSPIILGTFDRQGLNQNILFASLAILGVGVTTLLPETLGRPLRQQIAEIEIAKNEVRKTGYLAYKNASEYSSLNKFQSKSQMPQDNVNQAQKRIKSGVQ